MRPRHGTARTERAWGTVNYVITHTQGLPNKRGPGTLERENRWDGRRDMGWERARGTLLRITVLSTTQQTSKRIRRMLSAPEEATASEVCSLGSD